MTLRQDINQALSLLAEAQPFVEAKSCHYPWCVNGEEPPPGQDAHPACAMQRQWVADVEALRAHVAGLM